MPGLVATGTHDVVHVWMSYESSHRQHLQYGARMCPRCVGGKEVLKPALSAVDAGQHLDCVAIQRLVLTHNCPLTLEARRAPL